MPNLRTVASFWLPLEAHIVAGRMEAEGVPAFVIDEHFIGIDWMNGQALGGVKVVVREADVPRAKTILAALAARDFEVSSEEADHEPARGSALDRLRLHMRAVASIFGFLVTGIIFPMPARYARQKISGP